MNWPSYFAGIVTYLVFDIVLSVFLYRRWKRQMGFGRG